MSHRNSRVSIRERRLFDDDPNGIVQVCPSLKSHPMIARYQTPLFLAEYLDEQPPLLCVASPIIAETCTTEKRKKKKKQDARCIESFIETATDGRP